MEFHEYLKILLRGWWLLILSMILGGGGLWLIAQSKPITYTAVSSLSLVKQPEPTSVADPAYQFDNFYALQSAQTLSQMMVGWIADPVAVTQIYTAATVKLPAGSISSYERLIRYKVLPGGTLEILVTAEMADEAERLANATTTMIEDRLDTLVSEDLLDPVKIFTGQALSQANVPSTNLFLVVGIAFGFLLGLLLAFVKEGFRSEVKD
ncbi:hypothetical protein HY523_02655 [Candidatus Berkelbacteria bacterium]|nr:hypothetical protein [Candidatus Berkelbacteria bacterium]